MSFSHRNTTASFSLFEFHRNERSANIQQLGDAISRKPFEKYVNRQDKNNDKRRRPGDKRRPVNKKLLLLGAKLCKADFGEYPVFGKNHGANGHEDQSIESDKIQQPHKNNGETG